MEFIFWIALGAVFGFIVHLLSNRRSFDDLFSTVSLGVLGSLLGGLVGNLVFRNRFDFYTLATLIVASLGGLLVLFLDQAHIKR